VSEREKERQPLDQNGVSITASGHVLSTAEAD